MATFLDVTGLKYFSNIFVFLFVWLAIYAILAYAKVMGDNKFVHILAGLLIGLLVLTSDFATNTIRGVAPIIAVVFILGIFFTMLGHMIGADVESLAPVKTVMLVIIVLTIVIAIGMGIRDSEGIAQKDGKDLSRAVNLLFNPKFLGMMFILMVSIFTVALLAGKVH